MDNVMVDLKSISRILLFCICANTTFAQTTDLQQLKTKLQQLEQMMQDLKKQIASVEANENTPLPPTGATASPPAKVPLPTLPTTYIGELTRTREVANQDPEGAARLDAEDVDPSLRGFFRLPGTGTLIKLGGFVKTDIFVDANKAGTYYGGYVPSSFPSSPQPHTVNATVSMRPSRFSAEFRQPVQGDETGDTVKAYLEYDFLGNYDRTSLRLRQFYAEYKNLLVGQTWSAFGDPDVFPDTLEFEGPPGIIGLRQPMVRYTQPLNNSNRVGISVEKSGTDTPFSTQFGTPVASSLWPDLVAFYRYENKYGHLHFAFVSRSVGGVIPSTLLPDLRNHVDGFGGSLSGAWGTNKNNVVFQLVFGKGISNYYNDNFGLGTDVGFNAHGKLVATPTGSGTFGYQHYWNKLLRSTISYGYTQINSPVGDPGTTYHISHYATANLIVQPTVRFLFGGEYIYGSLERKDGFRWIAPRIQGSVTYYINKYPKE
jgi:hypothetical protein